MHCFLQSSQTSKEVFLSANLSSNQPLPGQPLESLRERHQPSPRVYIDISGYARPDDTLFMNTGSLHFRLKMQESPRSTNRAEAHALAARDSPRHEKAARRRLHISSELQLSLVVARAVHAAHRFIQRRHARFLRTGAHAGQCVDLGNCSGGHGAFRLLAPHGGLQFLHHARVVLRGFQETRVGAGRRHGVRRQRARGRRCCSCAPSWRTARTRRSLRGRTWSMRRAVRLRSSWRRASRSTTSTAAAMATISRAISGRAPSAPARAAWIWPKRTSARRTPGWTVGWSTWTKLVMMHPSGE
jgi:hypothetical protein